jgi:hypothetical protein
MKVIVEGSAQEIADLVLAVQGQLTEEMVSKDLCAKINSAIQSTTVLENEKIRLNAGETTINRTRRDIGLDDNEDAMSCQRLTKFD